MPTETTETIETIETMNIDYLEVENIEEDGVEYTDGETTVFVPLDEVDDLPLAFRKALDAYTQAESEVRDEYAQEQRWLGSY
ncbi:MAG: hypothetical protein JW395_2498 [Nitrospira sp.]|nr:hypothetical protein [Nitrospira sp.]